MSFRFIPGRKSSHPRGDRRAVQFGNRSPVTGHRDQPNGHHPGILSSVGVDLTAPLRQVQMTTVSGTTTTPVVRVPALRALGQTRSDFEVVSHQLPSATTTDGLLGLDFFQGLELTIDFRSGEIRLA